MRLQPKVAERLPLALHARQGGRSDPKQPTNNIGHGAAFIPIRSDEAGYFIDGGMLRQSGSY
jgi:hypothetical protein